MRTFDYQLAGSVVDAIDRAAAPDAMYLAGGTNVVNLMRQGVYRPAVLVDISRLDLGDIQVTEAGGLLIGAAVRNSDLAADPRVRRQYPSLSQALLAALHDAAKNDAVRVIVIKGAGDAFMAGGDVEDPRRLCRFASKDLGQGFRRRDHHRRHPSREVDPDRMVRLHRPFSRQSRSTLSHSRGQFVERASNRG